jgi:acyl-CoA reductase-like NAD-dependent aldehyde dehydrogenase
VLSPHVRAARCSIQAARIVREAAEAAGAPPGLIQWVERPSLFLAAALMRDPDVNLILATGQSVRRMMWVACTWFSSNIVHAVKCPWLLR